VTPKGRERAYEKRRYEEWQARLAAKRARNRRIRQVALLASAAVAVVALMGGGYLLLNGDDKSSTTASSSPSATPTTPITPSASASAAPAGKNPCPVPNVKPPAKPVQLAKAAPASDAAGKDWTLTFNTSCGKVVAVLDGKKAPQATAVMLQLSKAKYFDGSPCHRLLTSGAYILQCGDPTGTGTGSPGFSWGPVENAPKDNVYKAGTIAMARVSDNGNSMGSQFFLVYKDSTFPSDSAGGYTVLGHITKGLGVLTKVAAGGVTGTEGYTPVRPISILSTSVSAG
jgi:peptidyl-prolyl cis-trans isomerase B (cyclophilin B)